jgi:hypothetical protein
LDAERRAERGIKKCEPPRKSRACGYLGMSWHNAAPSDPLAALKVMTDEERIALFT